MTSVLSGKDIFEKALEICAQDDDIYLAVSYWSGGAVDALQIKENHDRIKVVLDVNNGGTSPEELKTLIDILRKNVHVHPDLHAKIYASKTISLVGSANASRPGLHLGGKGHAEGAAFLNGDDARSALKLAMELFYVAEPATKKDIEICRSRFGRIPLGRAEYGTTTEMPLIRSLIEQPDLFGPVPFILTNEEANSKERDKAWKRLAPAIAPNESAKRFDSKAWDGFLWSLDRRYRDRKCLALHVDKEGELHASLVRPTRHRDKEWTFARLLPWSEIEGLTFKRTGARRIKNSDGRKKLIRAVNKLADNGFVLGYDFIRILKEQLNS